MNTPNPLVPQGSLLEQQSQGRSRVRLALFVVVAAHAVFLGPLLIYGCKPESKKTATEENNNSFSSYLAPLDTSNLTAQASNTMDTTAPIYPTNEVVETTSPPPADTYVAPATDNVQATYLTPTTPEIAQPTTHTIVAGDTFSALASRYHVPLKELLAANPNADPTRLQIGDQIVIPAVSTPPANTTSTFAPAGGGEMISYKIKSGDNLTKIARAHGTTIKAIQEANGMRTTRIRAGDTLMIPVQAPAPSAPTESAGSSAPPTALMAPTGTTNIR